MKTSTILIVAAGGVGLYYFWKKTNPPASSSMPTSSWLGQLQGVLTTSKGLLGGLFGGGAPSASSGAPQSIATSLDQAFGGLLDSNTWAWSSTGTSANADATGISRGTKNAGGQPAQNGASDTSGVPSNQPSSLDDLMGGSSFQLS